MRLKPRIFSALALGTLLVLPLSMPDVDAGRDDTRCKQACRTTKINCDSECDRRCAAQFPNNFEDRNACLSQCKSACARQERECRLGCKVDRPPVTPENP